MKKNTQAPMPQPEAEPVGENPFAVIEAPQGMAECYWCSGFRSIDKMKKAKQHNTTIYICSGCQ